jgi:uncharacterized protein YbaP (TraB family)
MLKAYQEGDLKFLQEIQTEIDKLVFNPEKIMEHNKIIVEERNIQHSTSIDEYLSNNPSKLLYVVLGACHLYSTDAYLGVIDLLIKKGWKLNQK